VQENERRSIKPVIWILGASFIVSLLSLIIYLVDANFSDRTLFLLLIIVRYSSFMMCICSLYKIFEGTYYFIRRGKKARPMRIYPYMLLIIYGLTLVFLESFVNVISVGNE